MEAPVSTARPETTAVRVELRSVRGSGDFAHRPEVPYFSTRRAGDEGMTHVIGAGVYCGVS